MNELIDVTTLTDDQLRVNFFNLSLQEVATSQTRIMIANEIFRRQVQQQLPTRTEPITLPKLRKIHPETASYAFPVMHQ